MVSPFRRRQQLVRGLVSGTISPARATSAPEAPLEPAADTAAGQEYAALRVLLHDNLRALADIKSHEARNPKKREFARAFDDWIEGVLIAGEQGRAAQDEVLVTNLIWALDYGDIDYALRLGAHAIRHGLILPERFTRTVACFLAEEVGKLALTQRETVTHEHLLRVLDLIQGHDMADQVVARLHKALGRSFTARAEAFDPAAENARAGGKQAFWAEALFHCERAIMLDQGVGVKKDIEQLQRKLRDAGAGAETPTGTATPASP